MSGNRSAKRNNTDSQINLNKQYLDRLIKEIVKTVPTEAIYIFGSYARKEETPDSDLDIFVIVSDNKKKAIEYAIDIRANFFGLYSEDHLSKDIICSTLDQFEQNQKDPAKMEYAIFAEGVKIYEKL